MYLLWTLDLKLEVFCPLLVSLVIDISNKEDQGMSQIMLFFSNELYY